MKVNKDALEFLLHTGGESYMSVLEGRPDSYFQEVLSLVEKARNLVPYNLEVMNGLYESSVIFLADTLRTSVRTAIGDAKEAAVLLSGGVDSTALLGILVDLLGKENVMAYHTDWGYEPRSEAKFAAKAADHFGVVLRSIDVNPDRQARYGYVNEALARTHCIDYSIPPVYMALYHIANNDGYKTIANALGPDEYLLGYQIHRKYSERSSLGIVPDVGSSKYARAIKRKYGTEKAWFLSQMFHNTKVVQDSCDISSLKKWVYNFCKAPSLLRTIENWTYLNMHRNYRQNIETAAMAANHRIQIIFPFISEAVASCCLAMPNAFRFNKKVFRDYLRTYHGVPEEIVSRGEKWDKLAWGGTVIPYYQSEEYMGLFKNQKLGEWFTEEGISRFYNNESGAGLLMKLFLKTLEISS
jgi:asparagine synthetase B (glutamine-hydrolysing)